MQVEWDGNTEQKRAVESHLFMGGRGMHILAEGEDHPNSNIGFRSADISTPLVTQVVRFLVHAHFLCLM